MTNPYLNKLEDAKDDAQYGDCEPSGKCLKCPIRFECAGWDVYMEWLDEEGDREHDPA